MEELKIKNKDFKYLYDSFSLKEKEIFLDLKKQGINLNEPDYERYSLDHFSKKVKFRNENKSVFINGISPACLACRKGKDSITIKFSNICNRQCFYCYNYNNKDFEIKDPRILIKEKIKQGEKVNHLGISGGEPMLHLKEMIYFLEWLRNNNIEPYIRIYTNGDFINKKILQLLKRYKIKELRFGIKLDQKNNWNVLLGKMQESKKYIERIMVEMPVFPESFVKMKKIIFDLEKIKIWGINLLEFTYYNKNAKKFNDNGYSVKWPPFKYIYRQRSYNGYPVLGSELVCCRLLDYLSKKKYKIKVHYCSVANRLTPDLFCKNMRWENNIDRNYLYFSNNDFFIKTAVIGGNDNINKVLNVFNNESVKYYKKFKVNKRNFLEFGIKNIVFLRNLDIDIGIISSIILSRVQRDNIKLEHVNFKEFNLVK